jgi:transcriptional antiterminator
MNMKDTRRMILLFAILAKRKNLTVKQIRTKLPITFRTHVRSIQRDLKQLAKWAPLQVDRSEKPYRWSVMRWHGCPCCGRALSGVKPS